MNVTKEYVEQLKYYFNLCFGLYCLLENNFDENNETSYIQKKSFKMKEDLCQLLLTKKIINYSNDIIYINWDLYRKYRSDVCEFFDKEQLVELREQAKSWYRNDNEVI